MPVDLFAGKLPQLPVSPTQPNSSPEPMVDLFAPTMGNMAHTLMTRTQEWEDKANAATDPELKKRLNDVADAAADTLQKKPVDLFAAPSVPMPKPASLPMASGRGGAVLGEPGTETNAPVPSGGALSDMWDMGKAIGSIPGHLMSMFSSVLPPMPPGTMQEQGSQAWTGVEKGLSQLGTDIQNPDRPLAQTAADTITKTLGDPLHDLLMKGDTTKLADPSFKDVVSTALGLTAVKAPLMGAAASIASKARPLLAGAAGGSKILGAVDRVGTALLPKYNFPNSMYGIEGRHASEIFLNTIKVGGTKDMAIQSGELIAQNPKTAPFIKPETNLSPANIKALNAGYTAHMAKIGAVGPYGVPLTRAQLGKAPDYAFNRNGLNVIIDENGFMRSGTEKEFNALPVDQQAKIFNIRAPMDANHQEMYKRGLITDDEFTAGALGYSHKGYNLYHNREDWINQLKTDPNLGPALTNARAHIAQNLKDPFNPGQRATTDQVESQLVSLLNGAKDLHDATNTATVRSPIGSASQALLARTNLPKPLAELFGQMEGKYTPVSVGETLDFQTRILAGDTMFTRMTNEVSHDGRPLTIQNPPGQKLATASTGDGRPYIVMSDQTNPVWSGKWKDMQVHPDVIDAIHTLGNPQTTGAIARIMQTWKAMHVADNLPSHINHSWGDVGFSHYAGASQLNPMNWGHYMQAGKEILPFWKREAQNPTAGMIEAMNDGAIRPGFATAEAGLDYTQVMNPGDSHSLEQHLTKALNSKTQSQISSLYDMERQIARYGTYLKLKADGMPGLQAGIEVNKYYPTYDVSSPVGNFLRGRADMVTPLGTLKSGVGQLIGGPFTSFQFEAARIAMLAAKEHPYRFATWNMVPLTMTAIGMGGSGQSMVDYFDMMNHSAESRKGTLQIPVANNVVGGKPRFVDWTHMFPLFDYAKGTQVFGHQIPMDIAPGMLFSGPGWSLIHAFNNYNPQTGGKLVDPERGEGLGVWTDRMLQQNMPQSVYDVSSRIKSGLEGTQKTRMESEPQQTKWAVPQGMVPQLFNTRTEEDLNREGRRTFRGSLKTDVQGFKAIGKNPTISDQTKQDRKDNLRQTIQDRKKERE